MWLTLFFLPSLTMKMVASDQSDTSLKCILFQSLSSCTSKLDYILASKYFVPAEMSLYFVIRSVLILVTLCLLAK